jgi:hypothetical protein
MNKINFGRKRFADAATYDQATIDSTGAFFVHELERLDATINDPMAEFTWSRDIDVRTDVTMGDEMASWVRMNYGAPGGLAPTGKNFVGSQSTAIPGMQLDFGKEGNPLYPWAMEISYSVFDLAAASKVGRPIDTMKLTGLQLKWQMDLDEMVYVGDTTVSKTGLINNAGVGGAAVADNAGATSKLWTAKTDAEVLTDVNTLLVNAWVASGHVAMPDRLLLPPAKFAYLVTRQLTGTNVSLLTYIQQNNIVAARGQTVQILPVKFLAGAGGSGTDRMFAYKKDPRFVRFPMVPLQKTPLEYRGLHHLTIYYGKVGVVEWKETATGRYADGF